MTASYRHNRDKQPPVLHRRSYPRVLETGPFYGLSRIGDVREKSAHIPASRKVKGAPRAESVARVTIVALTPPNLKLSAVSA